LALFRDIARLVAIVTRLTRAEFRENPSFPRIDKKVKKVGNRYRLAPL